MNADTNRKHALPGIGRRGFVKGAGAVAVASGFASAPRAALAVEGGAKSVNFPADRFKQLTHWPRFGVDEKNRLIELINAGGIPYGEISRFEKEWAAYTGTEFVKNHMNGSSALNSMYFALSLNENIEPGSEVLVPSYTFPTATMALHSFSMVPIFVDIDPRTGCFDLEDAQRKLTSRTVAVEVMHSWGLPCEMDKIFAWAKEKGLVTMEDASHAHGSSMQGKKIGAWGDMSAFSLQGSKPVPTMEGGIGMYQTREYWERAATYVEYLDPPKFPKDSPLRKYGSGSFGQKYRMHPFAAVLARIQLSKLDEHQAIIKRNVQALNKHLAQLRGISEPLCRADQNRSYYHRNLLFVDFATLGITRDKLVKALKAEGVDVSFWDYPLQHKQVVYTEKRWWHHLPTIPAEMPGSDYVNANQIMLPLFCGEADEINEQYVAAFKKVWANLDKLS